MIIRPKHGCIATILLTGLGIVSCHSRIKADRVIRNGIIYDGSGGPAYKGDLAIGGDSILAVGDCSDYVGAVETDAGGKAVAPGFINMLSQAGRSLLEDGKGQSDTRQGITLEVMGEGGSAGPLNPEMKRHALEHFPSTKFDTSWTTLGGY